MTKERIVYYDILRGIAIIAVIAIHGFTANATDNAFLIWKNAILFAVPLFLAISGFFMSNKKIENFNDYLIFLKNQASRVLVPYIIWCVPYAFMKIIKSEANVTETLYEIFTFQISFVFYYIALIIQCYLLLPVLLKINGLSGLIISGLISLAAIIVLLVLRVYYHMNPPLIIYGGLFPCWIVFFQLGLFLGKGHRLHLNLKISISLVAFFLLLAVIESKFFQARKFDGSLSVFRIVSVLYCFSVVSLLLKRAYISNLNNRITMFLNKIGKYSFGIYLSHMLFLPRIGHVLQVIHVSIISQMLSTIFTIILCYMMAQLFERLLGIRYVSKYLGF